VKIDVDWGQIDRINGKLIVPVVDDRALTKLNQHLSLKEEHLDQVVSKFRSNQIVPTVDTRDIDRLGESLSILDRQVARTRSTLAVPMDIPGLDGSVRDMRVRMVIDDRQLRQRITVNLDINGNELSRSVEDSIKKGFKGVKAGGGNLVEVVTSVPKTIIRGFQEGIGLTYAQSLTKGTIKGLEEQFGASVDRVGQGIGSRAAKVGKVIGNGLVQRAGYANTDELKGKIGEWNEAFVDLFPIDVLEKKLGKVESRLMKIIDNLSRFRPVDEQIQGVQGFAGAIGELQEVPKQGIKNRRAKQVRKYAEQVKQSGEGEKVDIADDVHTIIIATGGFAGQKGKSSEMVGKKLQSLMGDGYHVVSVDNTNTDVSMPLQEAGVPRWLAEGGGKIAKNKLVDGINPDAVNMATLANQLQQQYPGKKIKFAGFSSGGIVANDATELYQATGKQAEGVAIGSPIFNNAANEKLGTFSAVLRKEDGVNKVAKKIEQVTGIGLNKKVTTMTEGDGHELALYLSDPKSQRVILDRLGSKNEPLRNKSAADFDVINYKDQAEKSLGDLGYQLANPIGDPKVNRILLEQKLAGIKETRASIKQSLPQVQEGKAELIEYLQALNEANALLNQVLKLPSIPVIGTPDPKPAKQQKVANDREVEYDPFAEAPAIAARIKARKQTKSTDPWSDNYVEPSLDLFDPGLVESRPKLDIKPNSKRRNREEEYVNAEFVEQPVSKFEQFSQSIDQTLRAGSETARAIAETAKAGQSAAKLAGEVAKSGQEGVKVIGEAAKAGSKIMQFVGGVADAAHEGVRLIGETAKTATAMMGGVGDAVRAMTGRSEHLHEIGGGEDRLQLPGGMRTIHAIEGDDTNQQQLGSQGARLALPPSDDLRVSKDYMKQVEVVFAEKKAAIYKAIESGDIALINRLKTDYKDLITRLEGEIQKGIDNGDRQTKEFYNSGGVKSQLAHKKRFAENIDVASELIESDASPDEIKQAQIVSDANLRKLTARTIRHRRDNPTSLNEQVIDIQATPVVDTKPTRVKQTKANVISDMMTDRKLKIERAIEDGDLRLVREHHQELTNLIQDGRDLIKANPNSISLKSNFAAQLGGKEKFAESSGRITDLLDGGTSAADIDNQPNVTAKLKKSAKLGLKSLLIDQMRDREGGYFNLGARIPGLDFLDTPVQDIIPNIKSRTSSIWQESRGKYYLDRGRNRLDSTFTRSEFTRSEPPSPSGKDPIAETEKSKFALDKLIGVGKLGLAVFGGYTLLSLGVPAMISLGKATFDTAANFERLQVKLAAASDSAATGKQKFAQLSATADRIGISRSAALETGAFIGGTTFGTQLDGKPSDRITDQILQVAQARGLNKQETDGFNLAIAQTLGRSRTSAQEINQLTQSAGITDARAIAARGLGYTPAQFSAIQDSPTGIDSKRFVQAFLTQAVQDSLSGKDLAQDSVGFKQGRAAAAIERTSGNVGGAFLPPVKAALDLFTSSLKLFNDGLERSSGLLMGLAIGAIGNLGIQALTSGTALNSALGMAAISTRELGAAAIGQVPKLASLAAIMIGFAVAGEIWRQVANDFQNSSQDIVDAAKKIGAASEAANQKAGEITPGKPQTTDEIQGKDWGEQAKLALQRGNRAFQKWSRPGMSDDMIIDSKQKEQNDRTLALDDVLTRSQKVIDRTPKAITDAKSVTQIDLDLNRIDTERSGLFSSGNPDGSKLAALDDEYRKKTSQREDVITKITPQKNDLQEGINATKGAISDLTEKFNNNQVPEPEYFSKLKLYESNLKDLEEQQRKLNEAIKSGFDNLTPWVLTLDKIVGKFEDITTNATLSEQKLSIARNIKFTSGKLTPGESEYQASLDRQGSIRAQTTDTAKTIKELRSALNAKDPNNVTNVQKAYGIDNETTATQIKIRAEKATSLVDKETLTKLAVIKEQEYKLTGLQSQFSDARSEMYKRIESENREAMLYYVSLAKQIDPVSSAFNKAISSITVEKNRLMSKLEGYGNGLFDGLTNSVIDLFESIKDRLNIAKTLAKEKKDAIDTRVDVGNQMETNRLNRYKPPSGESATPTDTNSSPAISPNSQLPTPKPPTKNRQITATQSVADSPGYSRSSPGLQPKIDADLSRLTPAERERYLHTTLSVDGKTDLAPDEWDRKWNPSVFGKNKPKPRTVQVAAPSQSNSQPVSQPTPTRLPQSPAVTKAATVETATWVNKQEGAKSAGYDQTIANAEAQGRALTSDRDYKTLAANREERRQTRQKTKSEQSEQRKQKIAVQNLAPAITIQDKQARELSGYDAAGLDKRDDIEERKIGYNEQIADFKNVYIPGLQQIISGKHPEVAKLPKSEQIKMIALAKDRLKEITKTLKELEQGAAFYTKLLTGYNKQLAIGRAKIKDQQEYDNKVTVEQNQIKQRENERTGIEGERANIAQQLPTNQFNQTLNTLDQELEVKAAKPQLENERTQHQRDISDRDRKGEYLIGRTPEQAKAYVENLRVAVNRDIDKKIQTALEKKGLRQTEFNFGVDQKRGEQKSSAERLDIDSEQIVERSQTISDKTDSPYANNIALDREFTRKIAVIKNKQTERDNKYRAELEKIKGQDSTSAGLRAETTRQYQQANFQDEQEKEATTKEYGISKVDRDSSRREHLYGRQKSQFSADLGVYDAGIQSQKLRGQDTKFEEYSSRKSSIQADTSQQKFDLNQRRAKLTALTPEADADRAAIDKLLASLDRLEGVKLNNLATEFSELTQVIGSTQKATREVLGDFAFGKKDSKGKLIGFNWQKMLSAPFEQLAGQPLDRLTSGLFAGLSGGQAQAPQAGSKGVGMDFVGGLLKGVGGLFGMKFAEGGIIGQGRSKADDQLILAQRGEGIITHRGMDMLGERGLHMLNRGLPPLPKFATGGVVGSLNNVSMNLDSNRTENSSSNNVNFNIDNRGGVQGDGKGSKQLMKELEAAVTHVLIKNKRAQTGLV
jgi:hypothetical protein